MKCNDIDQQLDDYLDNQLSPFEQSALELHADQCPNCAAKIANARLIMRALRSLPVAEPSVGFEQRVFRQVRDRYSDNPGNYRFSFAGGFATAALASLLIWFAYTVYMAQSTDDQIQVVAVAMDQTQTVNLLFDSVKDIQQAAISIELPAHMELNGYPGQKGLSWQTSLQKGQNVLTLPINALQPGEGKLTARLSYGDKVKTFSLLLKTTLKGAIFYLSDQLLRV